MIGILAQRTFAPFSPWRRSGKLITEQNRVVIGVKCVESEYNHCAVVYIVEPGDENNGDWVNAMQSEEAEVEEELDEEGEDFDPGDLLGKVLALINQVFIFSSI